MRYERDEEKRLANLDKHRLDFTDAEKVFEGHLVELPDDREGYGEDRFLTRWTIGQLCDCGGEPTARRQYTNHLNAKGGQR